jgi:tellurite resistance protein
LELLRAPVSDEQEKEITISALGTEGSASRAAVPEGPIVPGGPAGQPWSAARPKQVLRIPPNLFGVAFGIAGLAEAWQASESTLGTPQAVPDAISILATCVWLAMMAGYLAQGRRQVIADLKDQVLAPFVAVAPITAMLLSTSLARYALGAGQVLVAIFLAITIALGGWLTGQWVLGGIDQDSLHAGYFLPTVAGGLVGAFAAAQVHFHSVAEASFGIGVLCWALLGSLVLNRLFFRPRLAGALFPTMAIELAPPAVAGVAYFAITGGATGPVAEALAGYAVLMALVQLRLLPVYARLRFTPGNWAFTFSYAAAATDALDWTALKRPPGAATYATAVVAFITIFILAIGVRTGVAVARHQFLPKISVAGDIKETP